MKVLHDPEITKKGSAFRHMVRVEVEFFDNAIETETREHPRGSEHDFASEAEIINKFKALSKGALKPAVVDRLINMILELEKLPSASVISHTMSEI